MKDSEKRRVGRCREERGSYLSQMYLPSLPGNRRSTCHHMIHVLHIKAIPRGRWSQRRNMIITHNPLAWYSSGNPQACFYPSILLLCLCAQAVVWSHFKSVITNLMALIAAWKCCCISLCNSLSHSLQQLFPVLSSGLQRALLPHSQPTALPLISMRK